MSILAAAERSLTDTPETARAVQQRMDCSGESTARHCLNLLADLGRAERITETLEGGTVRVTYRKVPT